MRLPNGLSGRISHPYHTATVYLTVAICAILLFQSGSATAQTSALQGSISGQVFVIDSTGASYVPGATIVLRGDKELTTNTDQNGKYSFSSVEPGSYTIEANATGLEAQQAVTVGAGGRVEVRLELKLVAVTTSVSVEASSANSDISTTSQIIEDKVVIDAPNANERFETLLPLVPGVVRGPDGRVNMKGTRNTQSGALVNSANVTDPASGGPAINLPIDVVSSVQVVSNPFDPQYGRFTGALSTVETKTGNFEKWRFSVQNILPRWRSRAGTIAGLGAATPRVTFTGPIVKERVAFTESLEYRFLRTPVNSLPPMQRDTKLEGFNSYTQVDTNLSASQTATVSFALYPQKLDYMGLNTFTPQPATTDFRQRGYQVYAQHRYLPGSSRALVSQFGHKTYDVDTNPESDEPFRLLIETTEGGFFNSQHRRTSRDGWQENYQFAPRQFLGSHQFKVGLDYAHSELEGAEAFAPVQVIGASGSPIEAITYTSPTKFEVDQNETSAYIADHWSMSPRVSFDLGVRIDGDTTTDSGHIAPRGGVEISLTRDGKTMLKAGSGVFYDRVPLMLPAFANFPSRTVSRIGPDGETWTSTAYVNRIVGTLDNPRSTTWNVELDRQLTSNFSLGAAYERRNTARDIIVSPISGSPSGIIALSNRGSDSYREFRVVGRYNIPRGTINGSYVRSRAKGDLNDPFLFFGNYPQAVIQPDQRGNLTFDAPNRVLFWADLTGPWKLNFAPVYDIHTGFPYSVENEYRDYIGPRSSERFPRFMSGDIQITRPFTIHHGERHLKGRVGGTVFNAFNHGDQRDVQNIIDSPRFGGFFNPAWREYRGKLAFEF